MWWRVAQHESESESDSDSDSDSDTESESDSVSVSGSVSGSVSEFDYDSGSDTGSDFDFDSDSDSDDITERKKDYVPVNGLRKGKRMYCRKVVTIKPERMIDKTKVNTKNKKDMRKNTTCQIHFGPFKDHGDADTYKNGMRSDAFTFRRRMRRYIKKTGISMSIKIQEMDDGIFDVVYRQAKDPTRHAKQKNYALEAKKNDDGIYVTDAKPYWWIANMFTYLIRKKKLKMRNMGKIQTDIDELTDDFCEYYVQEKPKVSKVSKVSKSPQEMQAQQALVEKAKRESEEAVRKEQEMRQAKADEAVMLERQKKEQKQVLKEAKKLEAQIANANAQAKKTAISDKRKKESAVKEEALAKKLAVANAISKAIKPAKLVRCLDFVCETDNDNHGCDDEWTDEEWKKWYESHGVVKQSSVVIKELDDTKQSSDVTKQCSKASQGNPRPDKTRKKKKKKQEFG